MRKDIIDVNFMFGGEAGQGIQSMGTLMGKAFTRGGYFAFGDQDYESRIRGGHSFFRVRVKNEPVNAIDERIDILIAINKETIDVHQKELKPNGVVIFDSEAIKDIKSDGSLLGIPLGRLATEKAGDKLMSNTVALGAALCVCDYRLSLLEEVLRKHFRNEVAESNVKAARAGYEYAKEHLTIKFGKKLEAKSDGNRLFLSGTDAIALGAMAAGCKFMSAYPMTPATPIMEYMASRSKDMELVVVQPEDEIAAVNMAIGAAFGGVRALTATSGSGFCLMVEGLGLAGMTETPVVIVNGMRPGPAVGLPTRTEQGDLEFVISAHHGFFPRAVLAPATIEDAFWLTVKAFNLADIYQTPVILLPDHFLSTSYSTVDPFELSQVKIDRGALYSAPEAGDGYKRHKLTPNGISPRAFPGTQGVLVVTDSDEHDEEGHLTESARIRNDMVNKRLLKWSQMKNNITPPELHGPATADMTLIGWGSTCGALAEAAEIISDNGKSVNWVNLNELWPFPAGKVGEILANAKSTYVIENNPTGQLAHLMRAETGREAGHLLLKYDGRPITPAFIVDDVGKESA